VNRSDGKSNIARFVPATSAANRANIYGSSTGIGDDLREPNFDVRDSRFLFNWTYSRLQRPYSNCL